MTKILNQINQLAKDAGLSNEQRVRIKVAAKNLAKEER